MVLENCQLVLASHSIGMMRQAMMIETDNPGSVVFLDFSLGNFDEPQTIIPAKPNRPFWKRAYNVALGDLAGLIAPKRVVICEGMPATNPRIKHPCVDARCYNRIFENEFPDTEFVSLGNDSEVMNDRHGLTTTLHQILGATSVVRLIDRDDRTDETIKEMQDAGIRVLSRRNLEAYLFNDEVICRLAEENGKKEKCSEILKAKEAICNKLNSREKDNLKLVRGEIFEACRNILELVRRGNDTEEFMIETLSPLVKSDMKVYDELKRDIFET